MIFFFYMITFKKKKHILKLLDDISVAPNISNLDSSIFLFYISIFIYYNDFFFPLPSFPVAQRKKGERISNNYVFAFVFRARGQGLHQKLC